MTMPASIHPQQFKLATREQWDKSAQAWNDQSHRIRSWLCHATDAMLSMAEVGTGMRVLDVAAGAGDQTLDIAERVGPSGSVLATDLSPAILALADETFRRAGLSNVVTRTADGEDLGDIQAQFDAAICRLGAHVFPEPGARAPTRCFAC